MLSPDPHMTDEHRWPQLDDAGRRMLKRLTEHRHAPRFNFQSGDRLTAAGLERVREFEAALHSAPRDHRPDGVPAWVTSHAERCLRLVPFYRRRGDVAGQFLCIPTTTRADLAREPWSFVPDGQALDDLITYPTSGTTGQPMLIPSHPVVSSMYLAVVREALAKHGVALEGGNDRVAIALVAAQLKTLTYASVSAYLGQAGFVKLNLNPDDWNDPADRARYLDDCDAEIISGDPLSLAALTELPLGRRPKALVSGAMTMLPGLRRRLEERVGCPVVDLYAMNEHRPIAAAAGDGSHEILAHDVYVEVLDPAGRPCPPGARGEVTLTGGRNPFLPLLRYRTGDFAAVEFRRGTTTPVLRDFEGRPPLLLLTADGRRINTIDVTTVLRPFALSQFRLHQHADMSLTLKVRGVTLDFDDLREVLHTVFPTGQRITVEGLGDADVGGGKVLQYSSELGNAAAADPAGFTAAGARDVTRWTTSSAPA